MALNPTIMTNQTLYICNMANLANPKPLFVSSYRSSADCWFTCISPPHFAPLIHHDFTLEYNNVVTATNNIYIMCDQYKQPNGALRDMWNFFKTTWTSRNTGNFMDVDYQRPHNSHSYAIWSELFPKAASLGLDLICLYSSHDLITTEQINSFCSSAFSSYYLRGFAQTVTVYESCDLPNCKGCENPNNWYIDEIIYHNNWFEVYPYMEGCL